MRVAFEQCNMANPDPDDSNEEDDELFTVDNFK